MALLYAALVATPALGAPAGVCTLRGVVQVQCAEILVTRPRGGRRDEARVRHRVGHAVHDPRAGEQVVCPRGARQRFGVRECLRAYQYQVRQGHVLHGARHRADVAGMRGFDQYDANGGERHGLYHSGPFCPPRPEPCSLS